MIDIKILTTLLDTYGAFLGCIVIGIFVFFNNHRLKKVESDYVNKEVCTKITEGCKFNIETQFSAIKDDLKNIHQEIILVRKDVIEILKSEK